VPLYLTEQDVESLLAPEEALAPIEECFRRLARGAIDNRPRTRQPIGDGGAFAVMSAVDAELELAGVKSYAATPGGTPFVVALFDTDQGELAASARAQGIAAIDQVRWAVLETSGKITFIEK